MNDCHIRLPCSLKGWNVVQKGQIPRDRLSKLPTEILLQILKECGYFKRINPGYENAIKYGSCMLMRWDSEIDVTDGSMKLILRGRDPFPQKYCYPRTSLFSLCAGLTCKKIYDVHWSLWGMVKLQDIPQIPMVYHAEDEVCYFRKNGDRIFTRNPEGIERTLEFDPYTLLYFWFISGGYCKGKGREGCKYTNIKSKEVPTGAESKSNDNQGKNKCKQKKKSKTGRCSRKK
ncbi:hypothetical protein HYFRA_00003022 [Hymenoscyphus fraxineus]|uniref:Uncharacterized protein n=1 Tax=Hymenoscyphus fraxineus TaxID=746836 RepID=A0A9N9KPM0_9HELO|nr:hypothetical protein HYFRA_00003022 [Hymenoscyphus fraxineus]